MNARRFSPPLVLPLAFAWALPACLTADPNPLLTSGPSGVDASNDAGAIDASPDTSPPPPPALEDRALSVVTKGDNLEFADMDLPGATGDRTVEAWVKTTFTGEGYALSYGTLAQGQGFLLGVDQGKAIVTQIGDSLAGNKTIADGQWHHLAVTYAAAGSQYTLFADGDLETTKTMTTNTVKTGNAYVGTWMPEAKAVLGIIDEVRVWTSVRSLAEIRADRSRRLSGSEAGLVVYFAMDATGRGPGIVVGNKASAASVRSGVTEGGTVELVPGTPF